MTSLKDATVLVTGANGGLGTAYVKVALERGARRVYATARTPQQWDDERVVALTLDVSDPASIEEAKARAGDVSILINNAATFPHSDLLTAPVDEIRATLDANLLGPILTARAFAPALRSAKGALVNVGSVLSWFAVGKAHSVSKAGLWMATNALRLELAPDGVQVLGVYPGPIDTPMQLGEDRAGMSRPSDIAAATFDALEAGEFELIPDEMAKKVHGALSHPVTALYPALAPK
ncbi:SDR family oxidoreductase [Streptomyces liangshanensis]|uniref:SDR family oxidoreductase n=1 Tax=Streptomyces liangshanensis TaxID=2717324 RepID=A0A6G9H793_9ACTN|nr:SDR family oxidoreductase [Streptomyces liangshanensis]QIQ06081.1 SDR family oxidoreductase [Streptomyces liangshanensis]